MRFREAVHSLISARRYLQHFNDAKAAQNDFKPIGYAREHFFQHPSAAPEYKNQTQLTVLMNRFLSRRAKLAPMVSAAARTHSVLCVINELLTVLSL